jgi:hypothetical protein
MTFQVRMLKGYSCPFLFAGKVKSFAGWCRQLFRKVFIGDWKEIWLSRERRRVGILPG